MFFFGVHPGNFALEVGNPGLESERALGVDLSLRWRTPRASGEVTYFRNDINDYIFRRNMDAGGVRGAPRRVRGAIRRTRAGRHASTRAATEKEAEDDFAFVEYVGADALLQGIESHADFQLTSALTAEAGLDFVRGSLKEDDLPLPRIPPLKFRGGLRYQRNALQIGGQVDRRREAGSAIDE